MVFLCTTLTNPITCTYGVQYTLTPREEPVNRTQTVLLAAITVMLGADLSRDAYNALFTDAYAASAPTVACETWVFDMEVGKAKGAENVEAHRRDMAARAQRMFGDGGQVIYSNTFPILNGASGNTAGYSGVYCVARSSLAPSP
jgi:hypothetical protein